MIIRSPIEWLWSALGATGQSIGSTQTADYFPAAKVATPEIRRITSDDIRLALSKGFDDFAVNRTYAITLALIYPVAGLLLATIGPHGFFLPMVFPLVSGFALVGPFAAIWFYEMSRRREGHDRVTILDAFGVLRSPQIVPIATLGFILILLLRTWLSVARLIYDITLGPLPPLSLSAFIHDSLLTPQGLAMLILGVGVGFLFAVVSLGLSLVSFPLLLDRPVTLGVAIDTAIAAFRVNRKPILLWGGIVTAGLILGSIPFLLGLAVVLPVLGHSTWHLYRRIVK
jgi:uncharacterized membrane protein